MILKALLQFPGSLLRQFQKTGTDTTPQKRLHLPAFMGRWYEQARFENSFEYDLDGVYSDYFATGIDQFRITNHGTDARGRHHLVQGMAQVLHAHEPGLLRVSFVPPYTWFTAPMRILYTDRHYKEALLCSSGGHCLWLLTREKHPGYAALRRLLKEAKRRGFNTLNLRHTIQY